MNTLPELLNEVSKCDARIGRDIDLILGLTCQERHFLSRCARSWGLPDVAFMQMLIRAGGDPFLPSRREE